MGSHGYKIIRNRGEYITSILHTSYLLRIHVHSYIALQVISQTVVWSPRHFTYCPPLCDHSKQIVPCCSSLMDRQCYDIHGDMMTFTVKWRHSDKKTWWHNGTMTQWHNDIMTRSFADDWWYGIFFTHPILEQLIYVFRRPLLKIYLFL